MSSEKYLHCELFTFYICKLSKLLTLFTCFSFTDSCAGLWIFWLFGSFRNVNFEFQLQQHNGQTVQCSSKYFPWSKIVPVPSRFDTGKMQSKVPDPSHVIFFHIIASHKYPTSFFGKLLYFTGFCKNKQKKKNKKLMEIPQMTIRNIQPD